MVPCEVSFTSYNLGQIEVIYLLEIPMAFRNNPKYLDINSLSVGDEYSVIIARGKWHLSSFDLLDMMKVGQFKLVEHTHVNEDGFGHILLQETE